MLSAKEKQQVLIKPHLEATCILTLQSLCPSETVPGVAERASPGPGTAAQPAHHGRSAAQGGSAVRSGLGGVGGHHLPSGPRGACACQPTPAPSTQHRGSRSVLQVPGVLTSVQGHVYGDRCPPLHLAFPALRFPWALPLGPSHPSPRRRWPSSGPRSADPSGRPPRCIRAARGLLHPHTRSRCACPWPGSSWSRTALPGLHGPQRPCRPAAARQRACFLF